MQQKKNVFRNFAMLTQLGLSIMTPIFLCIFVGYYIDTRFGTKLTFFLLILGFFAGGRNGYLLAKHTIRLSQKEEEQEKELKRQQANPRDASVSKPKQPSRIRRKT